MIDTFQHSVPQKILIADDDEDFLTMYATLLERAGFTVYKAHNGKEAVDIAFAERPQGLILDINMPEKDGGVVAKEVREDVMWGKNVPIIVMTGKQQDDTNLSEMIKYNPTYYLIKGSKSNEEFVEVVKNVLKGHG